MARKLSKKRYDEIMALVIACDLVPSWMLPDELVRWLHMELPDDLPAEIHVNPVTGSISVRDPDFLLQFNYRNRRFRKPEKIVGDFSCQLSLFND